MDKLKYFLIECDYLFSMICITETWCSDESCRINSSLEIPKYKLLSFERKTNKRGGGIITYIRNDQITKIREDLSTSDADSEVFTIEITSNKSKNILVSTCYRPPEDCLQYEKNANIKLFFDEMLQYYIFPIINKPTRVTPTSITAVDNILTNSIFDTSLKAGIIKTDISDHFPVFFSLTQDIKSINSCKIKIYKRKINKFAIQQFKDSLSAEQWDKVYQECNLGNTNSAYNYFEKIFLKNYNMHFPIKEKLIKEKYLKCPWITKGIKKSSKKKQKLYIKYLKNRSEANLNVYKQYKNLFEKIKKNSKKNFYSNKIKNSNGNIKKTWDIIKEIIGTKHCIKLFTCTNQIVYLHKSNCLPAQIVIDNNEYNDYNVISEKFNSFFVNIGPNLASKIHCPNNSFETYLTSVNSELIFKELKIDEFENAINSIKINKSPGVDDISSNIVANVSSQIRKPIFEIFKSSIKTGTVPDKLKVAKIIPIFKTGETFQINNYRPISILPIFSKILERIIYNRLYEYLIQNKLLDKKQFGFQSQHSTEHAVLDIVNSISDSFNKKQFVLGTFIDLSKAFDTINHDILLKKMEKYGIKNTTLDWFKSYLCNRQQCVISNDNKYSNLLEIKCGVPQGSILGPLLFLIYINDLPQSLKKLDAVMFADDTSLFYSSASIENLFESVNDDLENLNTWFKVNKLSLNTEKTKYILFHSNHQKNNIPRMLPLLKIDNINIERTKTVKFLGIIIDETISWKAHINTINTKISKTMLENTDKGRLLCGH
ncbi:uncharacterized protein LOC136072316 [Hydra vulgaris]|uniref:uncharacterized protein LOC136072316 n=1 Tax=Hydra vulgaris TaxID=6087 RepID=UPI0032E9F8E6